MATDLQRARVRAGGLALIAVLGMLPGCGGKDKSSKIASEPRVKSAITPNENVNLTAGLVGHWTFDEGRGSIAKDFVGGNHGQLINGPKWVTGRISGALEFDGVDDFVDLGNILNDLLLPCSVAFWAKVPSGRAVPIISSDDHKEAQSGFWIQIMKDAKVAVTLGEGDGVANRKTKVSTERVASDSWVHIAVVIHRLSEITIWINAVESGGEYSGTGKRFTHGEQPLRFGLGSRSSRYLKGSLDDVHFFNRALNGAEVKALAGKGDVSATCN